VGRSGGVLAAGVAAELAGASASPLEIPMLAPAVAAATLVTVASGSLDQDLKPFIYRKARVRCARDALCARRRARRHSGETAPRLWGHDAAIRVDESRRCESEEGADMEVRRARGMPVELPPNWKDPCS
jgi:hypothetical protein